MSIRLLRPEDHIKTCNCIRCRDTEMDGAPRWCKPLIRQAKKNAGKRGIPFDLTAPEFLVLVERSGGHCEVSGIPFDIGPANGARRPYAASLDRVDSKKGYSFGNCRLVCVIVNLALNEWGVEALMEMAHCLVRRERQIRSQSSPSGWQTLRSFLASHSILLSPKESVGFRSRLTGLCRAKKIQNRLVPNGDTRNRLVRAYPIELLEEAFISYAKAKAAA